MTKSPTGLAGVLVVDKPAGMSSAAAVDKVKRALGVKRAGHAGTLDPIATGVLVVCLGEATKVAPYLLADDKAYEAELVLGIETDTLDRTGIEVARADPSGVTRDALIAALARRVGEQDQRPPMYSAVKRDGIRMYKRARAGERIEVEPRRVRIDRLELLAFEPPRARIAIACGKGTYVRSLIADLGRDLGCGAHMAELRRTVSGAFAIDQAQRLGELDPTRLTSITDALRLPIVAAPEALLPRLYSAVQIDPDLLGLSSQNHERFQIVDGEGVVIAIAHVERGRVVYDRVFPKAAVPDLGP